MELMKPAVDQYEAIQHQLEQEAIAKVEEEINLAKEKEKAH